MQDAEAAYAWLIAKGVPAEDILLVGESLGSGVAVQLSARHKVGAVALEAPYASAADVAAARYWWLPVRLLMLDQFRSIDHIAKINAPLLIQHGMDDEVIPFAQGQKLFAAAAEPKQFITWPATDHVGLFNEDTWATELAFFERVRPVSSAIQQE